MVELISLFIGIVAVYVIAGWLDRPFKNYQK